MVPREDKPPLFELEDHAFIERLKRKEENAWNSLQRRYRTPYLQQVIRQSLSKYDIPQDHLDDIEQKTWITAYEKIEQFELQQRGGLFHWLCSIQRNHVRNLFREPSHVAIDELALAEEDVHLISGPASQARSVEEQILSQERRREVLSALDLVLEDLVPSHREIVMRRLLWKEPVSELAQVYNIKAETISQMVWKAKKKLSNYLLAPELFFNVQMGKEAKQWNQ